MVPAAAGSRNQNAERVPRPTDARVRNAGRARYRRTPNHLNLPAATPRIQRPEVRAPSAAERIHPTWTGISESEFPLTKRLTANRTVRPALIFSAALLLLLSTNCVLARADEQLPQPFPELSLEHGTAFQTSDSIVLELDQIPENGKLKIPRLANVITSIRWIDRPDSETMTLKPEIDHWVISLKDVPANTGRPKLQLKVRTTPRAFTDSVRAEADANGVVSLPARFAETDGSKLRFEPQPHKNTVGYWAVQDDFAEWRLAVPSAGLYDVEILQGCGKGHGGSQAELRIGDQKLSFTVLETGHFQNFRWRHLGQISLPASDQLTAQLIATHKPGGAVMDCREIRLVPVDRPDAKSLRRTGINSDASRMDGRVVQTERPNVLMILTDDQGTLDAGCYGSRDLFTPRIDGLASDGVRFTQAYSHTVCCPARAMLMTGRHPQRSGINSWTQGRPGTDRGINMADSEVTLAEALQSAGYRTALFGKWHLGAAADAGPTRQGFESFFGHLSGFIDNFCHFYLHRDGFHDLYRNTEEVFREGQYFPDLIVDETVDFLNTHLEQHADRPFFVYLAFNIPHYPEQADPTFDQVYANTKMPRRSYGRMITTVDDRIGQVLNELDRLGLRENTVVVFQSDNGHSEEDYQISVSDHKSGLPKGHNYGPHGGGGNTGKWRGCKGTFYEGGLRVPAIISFPKELPTGAVRNQAVTLCDWMPTVLKLCDVEAPNDVPLDGASLLPIIRDNVKSHHEQLHWQWQHRWAVRRGDWKLIGNARNDQRELVRLSDDQPEIVNHADDRPAVVKELEQLHDAWWKQVNAAN